MFSKNKYDKSHETAEIVHVIKPYTKNKADRIREVPGLD